MAKYGRGLICLSLINEPILVRVHSQCLTGDALASLRCDCGEQLHRAMEMINKERGGVILYVLNQEGRGIGLTNKLNLKYLKTKKKKMGHLLKTV